MGGEVGGGDGVLLDEGRFGTAFNIAAFELGESGGVGDDFGATKSGNLASASTLGVGDGEVVGIAEDSLESSVGGATSDRSGGRHLGDFAVSDDGEVSPRAIGEISAVRLESIGSGGLNATISANTTAPDVDRGELGDVGAGGFGEIVARVSKASRGVGGGVSDSDSDAVFLTYGEVVRDIDVVSGVAQRVIVTHGGVVEAIDVVVGVSAILGAKLSSVAGENATTASVRAKANAVAGSVEVGAEVGLSVTSIGEASGTDSSVLNVGAILVRENAEANDIDVGRIKVSDVGFGGILAVNADSEGTFDVLTSISDVG